MTQMGESSEEPQTATTMQLPKTCHKFAAEHTAEDLDREEETARRTDPAGLIGRQSASRDDAVYVRMSEQLLVPGVQDAEETNLRTQMTWIASHGQQGFGAGTQQQAIDLALILQGHRRQLLRQRKDHMGIPGG